MIFEQVATGGCQSYLVGCPDTLSAALIDPEISQIDRYKALAARHGLHIRYVVDTHTHADHFSAARQLVRDAASRRPSCTRRARRRSPASGSTTTTCCWSASCASARSTRPATRANSMCLVVEDRVFTGDTLLIGGTGRTDLPTGDPEQLYESLFGKLLKLDPALLVYPAHDYKGRSHSTLGAEIADNPRLQKRERGGVRADDARAEPGGADPPDRGAAHQHERRQDRQPDAGRGGGRACRSSRLPELDARIASRPNDLLVLDVREEAAFKAGHIPGARHLPRGQLELRVNEEIPDPTLRIVTCCEFGKISTLAAQTLRQLGFTRAVALDGGMQAWREAGYRTEA